jgi:hypothetical protein
MKAETISFGMNNTTGNKDKFDIDALLHPARAFSHPMDVVNDLDLTLNEKRAILASWASDACAVEAAPALRVNPAGQIVSFDDVMDALRMLDRDANAAESYRRHKKIRRRRLFDRGRGGAGPDSHPL